MEGLLKEGGEAAEEDYENDAKDAALIGAAQRAEHYEIAGYATVRATAEKLDESKAAILLSQSRQEEKETDAKWSKLAHKMTIEEVGESEPQGTSGTPKAKGQAARA
jgi:ferritin-like metal-binding protein YciE